MEGLAELAFRRHHAQIHRYLTGKTGDPDRADDLAQEVFLDATVALSAGAFVPDSLPAWLHAIAKCRFADDARRRRFSLADPAWDGSDERGLGPHCIKVHIANDFSADVIYPDVNDDSPFLDIVGCDGLGPAHRYHKDIGVPGILGQVDRL